MNDRNKANKNNPKLAQLRLQTTVCGLKLGTPSVHRISLPPDFPSTQLSKEGLPSHTSPYFWYWIVVANGQAGFPVMLMLALPISAAKSAETSRLAGQLACAACFVARLDPRITQI